MDNANGVVKILDGALKQFGVDDQGLYIGNSFFNVPASLKIASYESEEWNVNRACFTKVIQDVWNISVFLERIEWMRQKVVRGELEEQRWLHYAQVDISSFHVELRSLMDYVAESIALVYMLNGKLPKSFDRVRERVDKYKSKLDIRMVELLNDTKWFSDIRHIRNSLVHHGNDSMVFFGAEVGTLFQVSDGFVEDKINIEWLMYNENVAYFEKYAALYFSHLLVFLDEIGAIFLDKLKIRIRSMKLRAPGFAVINGWISKSRSELI